MPAASPETLAALATIGHVLAHGQTRAEIHRAIDGNLVRLQPRGEFWISHETAEAFPRGLTMLEALGYTMVLGWAGAFNEDAPTRLLDERDRRWSFKLTGPTPARELPPAEALELARALLHIRRIVWPSQPWRLRDWIAEHLERQVRLLEAMLRGPTKPVIVTPYCAPSDVGRSWS